MSKPGLSEAQRTFVDALAELLGGWNMPVSAARLYAYLQIRETPATLEDIGRDLAMSRSNAWNAVRLLEHTADVRRVAERGTKRLSFKAGDDPGAPLRRQIDLLARMADLIEGQAPEVSAGAATARLRSLAAFHRGFQRAMAGAIASHRAADAPAAKPG